MRTLKTVLVNLFLVAWPALIVVALYAALGYYGQQIPPGPIKGWRTPDAP